MKKSVVIMMLLSFLMAGSYGCASKGYVKQQTDPLVERINKLETGSAQQIDRINKLEAAIAAAKADAEKAKGDAAEAIQTAKDCSSKSEADAQRADASAKRAESAAKKAEKAFELYQRK